MLVQQQTVMMGDHDAVRNRVLVSRLVELDRPLKAFCQSDNRHFEDL